MTTDRKCIVIEIHSDGPRVVMLPDDVIVEVRDVRETEAPHRLDPFGVINTARITTPVASIPHGEGF